MYDLEFALENRLHNIAPALLLSEHLGMNIVNGTVLR